MATANFGEGAVFEISDDMISKMTTFDQKLERIQKSAGKIDASKFQSLITALNGMKVDNIAALERFAAAIEKLGSASGKAGGIANVATGLNSVGTSAQKATSSLTQAAVTLNRMSASTTMSVDAQKSVEAYNKLATQISQVSERQTQLNRIVKEYELEMSRINSGKGGVIQAGQSQQVAAARQEIEANNQLLAQLRQKQQQIISVNQTYQQQIQMVNALKNYESQRTNLPNQRSQNTLAEMRKYYAELEKSSAKTAAQAERDAQKKAAAEERAAAQAQKAWERAAAQTPKYANQYHDQRQASLSSTFSKQNITASMALAENKAAKTLREEAQAVELLKQARMNLSRTDADYKTKLDAINNAIRQHNTNLQQAGVKSNALAQQHRNLMDISGQLARKFALLFSVSQIQGYIGQIAKVRGEFELQQRSLEAILQNKTQADQIFQKTVDLAVKSPFRIKELVSYTKQLAAYRIEGDKLYDTTKRLADVSAGLGVDMQRLILAYGQVKAAAYLRGTEVRQFTEAGVNMYGELKSYFQEVKGEAYTTAQIVDMISKRKVTFEDVEAVFQRLTSQGGLFYNMQEIQSETLNGKIANLKDSFDILKNDIGKDPFNEWAMKSTIDSVKYLADHWQTVATIIMPLVGVMGGFVAKSVAARIAASGIGAQWKTNVALIKSATGAVGKLKAAWSVLGAGIKGMGVLLAIELVTRLISKWMEASERAKEYNKTLAENRVKIDTIGYDFETAKGDEKQTLFEKQKTQLQKLQDEAAKQNIHINTELDDVTEENIADVFRKAQRQVQQLQDAIAFSTRMDEKNGNSEDDYKDFQEYSDAVITTSADMDAALNTMLYSTQKEIETQKDLLKNSKDMSESEVKRHNQVITLLQERANKLFEIQKIETNGANDFNNYIKKAQMLKDVAGTTTTNEYGKTSYNASLFKQPDGESVNVYNKYLKDVVNTANEAESAVADFKDGWIKDFAAVKAAHGDWFADLKSDDKKTKEAAENMVRNWAEGFASGDKWTEAGRMAFFKTLEGWDALKGTGFKVRLDTKDAESDIDKLQKELKRNFEDKEYSVKIKIFKLDMDTAFDAVDKEAKDRLKRLQKNIDKQRHIKDGLNIEGYDELSTQKEINEDKQWLDDRGYDQEMKAILDKDKKNTKNRKNEAAKAERDIWNERISVLKEMQQQYEKVREHYGEDTAKAMTLSEYMDDLKYVKIGEVIKPEDIVPTKQGLVDALEKVLSAMPSTMKDYFKKSSDLKKTISELKLQIKTEEANKKLEETKKIIDNLFSGLDLHKKLKDVGLSEAEVQALFPGLAKTLDDVERGINDKFNALRDKDGNLGTDEQKEYDSEIKKLNEQRIKEQQDLVVELTKAYKTQLSDQLQLDNWYYKEKYKIAQMNAEAIARINADDSLTTEQKSSAIENVGMQTSGYQENLQSQYGKKSNDNAWNSFKESDAYLMLFSGDMEQMSKNTLEMLRTSLDNLKTSMQNLDPAHLKEVMNIYNKIDNAISEKSPFAALIKDLQEIKKLKAEGWTEDALNAEIMNNDRDIASLEAEQKQINKIIKLNELKAEGKKLDDEDAKFLDDNAELAGLGIPYLYKELQNNKKIVKTLKQKNATAKQGSDTYKKTKRDTQAVANEWQELLNVTQSAWGSIKDVLAACGDEGDSTTEMIIDIIMQLAQAAVQAILFGAAMKSAMGPIGWIMIAIEAIAGIMATILGNSDKSKEKEIENLQRKLEALENAYDDLSDAMDDAWNFAELELYNEKMEANLKLQNQYLQSMIAAERSKKDSDQDKIEEWNEQINDNLKAIEENAENALEAAGGLGSKSNWKDAAQDFADAWVDAFNEGEDALDALNESFDDLITNMIKKQAMNRIVSSMLEPIFTLIDEAVDPEGAGGYKVLKEELDAIKQKWASTAPELDETLTSLMDILDYTPTNSTELSALQQGIEGVTETTAEALEALLNSIRFFLATQQGDVAAIRTILEAQYNTSAIQTTQSQSEQSVTDNNPTLTELKLQTVYLQKMSSNFDDVIKAGHTKGGKGIKVFMD